MTAGKLPEPPMRQEAPYPHELTDLVAKLRYRPGWTFKLTHIDRGQGSHGLTLIVTTRGYDTYRPEHGENYRVNHYMLVPPASYNRRSWQMWLFEQLLLVERHECMEFFVIGDHRPYAPVHAPGFDPYLITEQATDEERRTSFRGELQPDSP